MPITVQTYLAVASEDPEGHWELHRGRLREKPSMSFAHNHMMTELGYRIFEQVDQNNYHVRINAGIVRHSTLTYYVPDVFVIPDWMTVQFRDRVDVLEVYDEPLPFVAEIWSPSTGDYDVDAKLPEYQRRGDREIWRLHPFDHQLIAWRRQPDGSYVESTHRGGVIDLAALPHVTIDLDTLFT